MSVTLLHNTIHEVIRTVLENKYPNLIGDIMKALKAEFPNGELSANEEIKVGLNPKPAGPGRVHPHICRASLSIYIGTMDMKRDDIEKL